jgi:hypothetical protein
VNLQKSPENRNVTKPNPNISVFLDTVSLRVASIKNFLYSTNRATNLILTLTTGFLFGYSVSIGLGLNTLVSVSLAALVAVGVLISGSLVAYLLTQTVALASLAALSQVAFRVIPDFRIDAGVFQFSYLLIILLNPLLSLISKVKLATNSFSISAPVQLFTTLMFACLVQFLRSRMPSDAEFALTRMFEGEDNAGIVQVLSGSLKNGFTPHASLFGEFVNSIYLTSAGLISTLSNSNYPALLPALTHFNVTLLFMAWIPIAALLAIVLAGRNQTDANKIAILCVSTIVLGFLFWPFVTLGHTSVISSGLFAMSLLAVTLNIRFAIGHPIAYASIVTSFGVIIGTTWFPLMPFAAATVALTYIYLLRLEYKKGNVKIVFVLAAFLAALSVILLPQVLTLAQNSGDLLELQGGTRSATSGLITLTLFLAAIVIWKLLLAHYDSEATGKNLFTLTIAVLVVSNLYLLISALEGNQGGFGYGATKYLITTISLTLPVFWMLAVENLKLANFRVIATAGLVLILSILMVQPDSREVPAAIVAPQLIPMQLLAPPDPNDVSKPSAVASGLVAAFQLKPDHVICVSDLDVSSVSREVDFDSYFCNRWAGSLNSNKDPFTWGAVALGRLGKDSLSEFRANYRGDVVAVVRIPNPKDSTTSTLDKSETWWWDYADESWEVVTVHLGR